MNLDDEILYHLQQARIELKEIRELKEKLIADLTPDLLRYVANLYPEINKSSDTLQAIKTEAQKASQMAIQYLIKTAEHQVYKIEYAPKHFVPVQKTHEQCEKELSEFLKVIPETDHQYAIKIHWQECEQEKQTQQIKVDIHNIIKAALVSHFEEDILQLNSEYLHYLDDNTWIMVASPFVEKVFELSDSDDLDKKELDFSK